MCLCNRSVIEHHPNSQDSIEKFSNNTYTSSGSSMNINSEIKKKLKKMYIKGKPTDVSCLKFVTKFITTEELISLREINEIVYEEAFDVESRFHLVVILNDEDKKHTNIMNGISHVLYILMVKGAAEELYRRCSTININNEEVKITKDMKEEFEKAFLSMAEKQQSCLGFAYKKFYAPLGLNFKNEKMFKLYCPFYKSEENDLSFIGMIGIETLIRENVGNSISNLQRDGISLFITSGDHPETLKSVGNHILYNLNKKKCSDSSLESEIVEKDKQKVEVIHCGSLHLMTSNHWKKLLNQKSIIFFARAKPDHRLEIVKQCKNYKEIVTATGHGVLDSPTLREANTGIAVNAIGSILAQEAADIIAKHTTLSAITEGINEGKLLHKNFNKSIAYTLSHMLPEVIPILLTFIFGFPLILNSIQLIVIDLITELPPSIALIYQKENKLDNPRNKATSRSKRIPWKLLSYCYIQIGIVMSIGCLLSYFLTYLYYGISLSQISLMNKSPLPNDKQIIQEASAAWHITIVISQMFHIFSCATYRTSIFKIQKFNKMLLLAVAFEVLVTSLLLSVPFFNEWLLIKPPPYFVYIIAIVTGMIITLYNEIRKFLLRRQHKYSWVSIFCW
uniref:Cation_ATPase_C domain-containing protein n=1 Tax=Parastrongyloides trichosuri TaxID=131310 RepID=A0A0N5A3Y0_PARTI